MSNEERELLARTINELKEELRRLIELLKSAEQAPIITG